MKVEERKLSYSKGMANQGKSVLAEDPEYIWARYCGFLDLSMDQFKEIQEELLMEQMELMATSPLGRRLLRGTLPRSVSEFRRIARLTKYGDYLPDLENGNDEALPEPAYEWAHTTGARAEYKYVPYTARAFERVVDNLLGCFILAAANRKGEVNIKLGDRVLHNTPPRPFLSGLASFGLRDRFGFRGVVDLDASEDMEFKEKIEKGFLAALGSRLDILVSMTSILVRIGEGFTEGNKRTRINASMLRPMAAWRLVKALFKKKVLRREVLPKDLWPTKAILGWGIDTRSFKDQVAHYWGREPYEFYGYTEGGIVAMQAWNKKGLTLVPYSGFFEFIPEEESIRSWEDPEYTPAAYLLDELELGKRYEIVLTSFYGMPFLRYRVGHLVQVVAANDPETGVQLPQIEFHARCDDRIDLAGFTRMDERTIWQALGRSNLESSDWIVRNEHTGEKPRLHLYAEFKDGTLHEEAAHLLEEGLRAEDPFYCDLEEMLDIHPLEVTSLSKGTFDRYYEEKLKQGLPLPQRRPLRMRATNASVDDLLRLSSSAN